MLLQWHDCLDTTAASGVVLKNAGNLNCTKPQPDTRKTRGIWIFLMMHCHYDDVTMSLMASQITSLTIVCSTVYSGADQRKHQSSASLAFVRGIHQGPLNSPHKWPVKRKMFPFDDVIMVSLSIASKAIKKSTCRENRGGKRLMCCKGVE